MKEYPNIGIISDEIYYQLYYFDPKPTYFYQKHPELLKRTVIVDGISKTLASTGLRIGYMIGPKNVCLAASKLQGQTTSGANSLIQRALINFDFDKTEEYLEPIKIHLRENSRVIVDTLKKIINSRQLGISVLQLFIFCSILLILLVLNVIGKTRMIEGDYAAKICEDILEELGIAIVPGL